MGFKWNKKKYIGRKYCNFFFKFRRIFFFRFIFNDFLYIIDIERSVMLLIFKYENVYFDLFLDLSIGLIEGIIFSFWNEFY